MAKVFVGAPVRNRGWVLERHLEGVLDQDVDMEFCYILNDSTDDTEEILKGYGFPYITHNLGGNHGHTRGQYSFDSLSKLRNKLLDEFLKSDCDYLFSVDTDIIIPKGSLRQLIEDDKDVVSMLIKNHPTMQAHNVMIDGRHLPLVPEGVIECDLTGAVYLIKREVIEAGVRYAHSIRGEDVPFCESAKKEGYKLYCDTRLRPIHAYKRGVDLIAKAIPTK